MIPIFVSLQMITAKETERALQKTWQQKLLQVINKLALMKQSISLPHVDSQHIRGEIAGRRWSLVTRGYTHIFLHILRFDGLIRGVRRVERPKGKAAKKADKTGSEEGASAREHGLWVLTLTPHKRTPTQQPHLLWASMKHKRTTCTWAERVSMWF